MQRTRRRSIRKLRPGYKPSKENFTDELSLLKFTAVSFELQDAQLDDSYLPILDQKRIPCCVSIAISTCLSLLGKSELAPLFNYYQVDQGALDAVSPDHALASAHSDGICSASLHPTPINSSNAVTMPSQLAIQDAQNRRIPKGNNKPNGYDRLNRPSQWVQALAAGNPLFVCFEMSAEYESVLNGVTDVHPAPTVQLSEGHAVPVIGFSTQRSAFLIRDSFGIGAGNNGHWWMPLSIAESSLIQEAWVVRSITPL